MAEDEIVSFASSCSTCQLIHSLNVGLHIICSLHALLEYHNKGAGVYVHTPSDGAEGAVCVRRHVPVLTLVPLNLESINL